MQTVPFRFRWFHELLAATLLGAVGMIPAGAQDASPPDAPALFAPLPGPEPRVVALARAVSRHRRVAVRGEVLASLRPSAVLRLNLFDDADFPAVVEEIRTTPGGDRVVAGRLVGRPEGRFTLLVHGGEIVGDMLVSHEEHHALRRAADGSALEVRRLVPGAVPPCAGARELATHAAPAAPRTPRADPRPDAVPPDDGAEVDLLIVYTPAARLGAGGTAAIEALAALAVDNTNQIFHDSDIHTRVRLVRTAEIAYVESGDVFLDALRLGRPDDGIMDEVHAVRDAVRADLVSLFVTTPPEGFIGFGFYRPQLDAGGRPVLQADAGFSALAYDFASPRTLAHELGHNFGCQHDRENAQGTPVFPYSFGWRFTGTDRALYHDMMAYEPGRPVLRFSNPRIYYAGAPTGVADSADTARTVNETAGDVARFRNSQVEPPTPVPIPAPTPAPPVPVVTLTASVPETTAGAAPVKGEFTVSRTAGAVALPLSVGYRVSGSAVAGVQYKTLSGSVLLPAGAASAKIKVKPRADGVAEGTTKVKLTLLPGEGYTLGAPARATVKVLDAD